MMIFKHCASQKTSLESNFFDHLSYFVLHRKKVHIQKMIQSVDYNIQLNLKNTIKCLKYNVQSFTMRGLLTIYVSGMLHIHFILIFSLEGNTKGILEGV